MKSSTEATAMGHLLTQIRADGELSSLAEMRAVVHASNPVRYYDLAPKTVGRISLPV